MVGERDKLADPGNVDQEQTGGFPPGYDLDVDLDYVLHEGAQMRRALLSQRPQVVGPADED